MRRRHGLRSTVIVWTVTACEHLLLVAWKFWGVAGAGNLLTAWVIVAGLLGAALVFGPPGEADLTDSRVLGYRVVRVLDLGMAAALFWFGHSLLGILWLAANLGGYAYSRRCAMLRQGGAHG